MFDRTLKLPNTDLMLLPNIHIYYLFYHVCDCTLLIASTFWMTFLLDKYTQVKSSLSDWLFLVFPFIPTNLKLSLLEGFLANISVSPG